MNAPNLALVLSPPLSLSLLLFLFLFSPIPRPPFPPFPFFSFLHHHLLLLLSFSLQLIISFLTSYLQPTSRPALLSVKSSPSSVLSSPSSSTACCLNCQPTNPVCLQLIRFKKTQDRASFFNTFLPSSGQGHPSLNNNNNTTNNTHTYHHELRKTCGISPDDTPSERPCSP